ncbi:hypothetical protein EJB05_52384, partial [Eragrostis curvula]
MKAASSFPPSSLRQTWGLELRPAPTFPLLAHPCRTGQRRRPILHRLPEQHELHARQHLPCQPGAKKVTSSAPYQAYGFSQCSGDVNSSDCRACLDASVHDMAMLIYDACLLRHSNASFFSAADTSVVRCWWNPKTQNATQPAQFTSALGALMRNLTVKAA